jgi:hypothetical protein
LKYYFSLFTHLPRINQIVFLVGLIGIIASTATIKLVTDPSWLPLLDNMHWTFGTVSAAILALLGYRSTTHSISRKRAFWFFLGFTGYALGQIIWDIQTAFSYSQLPSPSDFFYLWLGPCMTIALFYEIKSHTEKLL